MAKLHFKPSKAVSFLCRPSDFFNLLFTDLHFALYYLFAVTGEILYQWPKAGQIRKVPREEVPSGVQIIQFFGMRDLQGKEQYSYLIESQHGEENHGKCYF